MCLMSDTKTDGFTHSTDRRWDTGGTDAILTGQPQCQRHTHTHTHTSAELQRSHHIGWGTQSCHRRRRSFGKRLRIQHYYASATKQYRSPRVLTCRYLSDRSTHSARALFASESQQSKRLYPHSLSSANSIHVVLDSVILR